MKGKGRNLLILLGLLSVFAAGCSGGGSGDEWSSLITVDATPPVIIVTNPVNGATNVPINTRITATFSEAMLNVNTTTFTVTGPGFTSVPGTVVYSGISATFTPDSDLADTTLYTARITTGATDLAGNPLAPGPVPNPWTFTTGAFRDETRPRVIFTDPANSAVNVPPNQKITADFSEVMDPTTIDTATFNLIGPSGAVTGKVAYAGTTAVFTPIDSLGADTDLAVGVYTALITVGAEDLSGNALVSPVPPGLGPVPNPWTFTVGPPRNTTKPIITFTDPVDDPAGDTPVARNHAVNATFSEPMNPTTIIAGVSFIVNETISGDTVLGTVSFVTNADTTIATFTPGSLLAASTEYTAVVTNMAEDLDGDTLVVPQSFPVPDPWHFWTGTFTDTMLVPPEVIDLGLAGSRGIVAWAAVTNAGGGPTVVNGDVAIWPGTAMSGFPPGAVNGTIHIADTVAHAVWTDLHNAYLTAMNLAPGTIVPPGSDLGMSGTFTPPGGVTGTFPPGVYTSGSSILIATQLTLDAGGNPNAVWVFQMPSSTLTTTTPLGNVVLANGAQAKNVFWQVGSAATLGSGTTFNGNILANDSISTAGTGVTINGRLLGGAGTSSIGTIAVGDTTTINVPAP